MQITVAKGLTTLNIDVAAGSTVEEVMNRADVATVFPAGDNDAYLDARNEELAKTDIVAAGTVINVIQRANEKA